MGFLRSIFDPGIFGGVSVGSPRDFFGFWFLPSFDHPCHLKSVVPWACYVASKFLWAACLLWPFWFVHVKWPHINWERFRLTVPFKSKLTICCESWRSTQFAILDSCANGESRTCYRELSGGPSLSGQKTKDAPTTDNFKKTYSCNTTWHGYTCICDCMLETRAVQVIKWMFLMNISIKVHFLK